MWVISRPGRHDQLIGFVGKNDRKILWSSWENLWFPVKIFPFFRQPIDSLADCFEFRTSPSKWNIIGLVWLGKSTGHHGVFTIENGDDDTTNPLKTTAINMDFWPETRGWKATCQAFPDVVALCSFGHWSAGHFVVEHPPCCSLNCRKNKIPVRKLLVYQRLPRKMQVWRS